MRIRVPRFMIDDDVAAVAELVEGGDVILLARA